MKRTRSGVRGFAAVTAVPFVAALLTVHPGVAGADPDVIGEITSGSATSEVDAAQAIDEPTGSSLGLGTGSNGSGSSSGVGGATSGSSSANGGASSGSSSGNGGANSGSALGVNPTAANPAAGGAYLSTGSSASGSGGEPLAAEIALPGAAEIAVPVAGPAPHTLGETLGLEPGSVLTACAGSAIIGSAAIGLGLVTGSGFGSGLLGPGFVPGSSGLVAPGSAGAGSVMLGSAVTGSALLTCLLLLPVAPDIPGTPLLLPSVIPGLSPVAAPFAPPAPAPPQTPLSVLAVLPPHEIPAAAAPLPEPANWNTMQMMTVLILTILGAARVKASRSRRG